MTSRVVHGNAALREDDRDRPERGVWRGEFWGKHILSAIDARYLDEIERTPYNAMLCGGSPDGARGLRRLRMARECAPAHFHFLPERRAVVAMKGPLALSRDARQGSPVNAAEEFGEVPSELPPGALRRRPAPEGCWKAWQLTLPSGRTVDLRDFSSAGNTWDEGRDSPHGVCAYDASLQRSPP